MKIVGWLLSAVLLALLVSTADYKIQLEQENERLRAQVAPKHNLKREVYDAVLCPSGNSIAQRIDKRRSDGVIIRSKWKRTCV